MTGKIKMWGKKSERILGWLFLDQGEERIFENAGEEE